jgi:hypothetical protein
MEQIPESNAAKGNPESIKNKVLEVGVRCLHLGIHAKVNRLAPPWSRTLTRLNASVPICKALITYQNSPI